MRGIAPRRGHRKAFAQARELGGFLGALVGVHQVFEGDIVGRAFLMFPETNSVELVRAGAARGASALGVPLSACRVVVIGDTPKDARAARGIDARDLIGKLK